MPQLKKGFVTTALIVVLFAAALATLIYSGVKNKQFNLNYSSEVSPTPVSDSGVIAGWKSYENQEFSYELKYPSDWSYNVNENNKNFVSFTPPDYEENKLPDGYIAVEVESFGTSVNNDEEANDKFQEYLDSCSPSTPTQCTEKIRDVYEFERNTYVSGKLAFQVYGGCCMGIGRHVLLFHDKFLFKITLYNLEQKTTGLKNEDVFNLVLAGFKLQNQPPKSDLLFELYFHGGLCQTGQVCQRTYTLDSNGSLKVDSKVAKTLNADEVSRLKSLIDSTDFVKVKSRKFNGVCPIAYDGQEGIYTFYTSQGIEKFSSCDVEIDAENELFSRIEKLVE